MTLTTSAAGIAWDLSDLFAGPDDPALVVAMEQCLAEAEVFAQTYRGTIAVAGGPDAEHLREGLERLEILQDQMLRATTYAALLFYADTRKPEHRNLQQQVEQRWTTLRNTLLFFDLEWLELSDTDAQRLIDDPVLEPYRHYLLSERRYRPHRLSEAEEQIINEKDMTGLSAWQRLFTEMIGSLSFPLELDGTEQRLTLDAMLSLLRHHDRDLRQRAYTTLYGVLSEHKQTLAYIYNTLVQDHLTMQRLRGYTDPMEERHLSNEIEPEVVTTMMAVVEQNYVLAHRYFALKARLLNLPRLQLYDQYAPVGDVRMKMSYEEGRETILEAFELFDPRFREMAALFFDRNWIDAEVRPGKQGGAFCMGYPPSNHPYILCNYTDDLRDVMTVAHELGHGIHFWLARQQTLFNFSPTLPLAETASVFAEMVTFEHLLGRAEQQADKLALLCGKIEDICATIFRQNVLTRFEQSVFAERAQQRLTPEHLGELWLKANQPYYGSAVEMASGYEWGWSYISHFINSPFYCYSYVFGELLVLALYGMYRAEGKTFVPRYLALLEAGGCQAPSDLLAGLGIDAKDPAFWQRGFDELERLVAWAEDLAA